jgi:hypothetical protein
MEYNISDITSKHDEEMPLTFIDEEMPLTVEKTLLKVASHNILGQPI